MCYRISAWTRAILIICLYIHIRYVIPCFKFTSRGKTTVLYNLYEYHYMNIFKSLLIMFYH